MKDAIFIILSLSISAYIVCKVNSTQRIEYLEHEIYLRDSINEANRVYFNDIDSNYYFVNNPKNSIIVYAFLIFFVLMSKGL